MFAVILLLTAIILITFLSSQSSAEFNSKIFAQSVLVGIVAQMIDGALGMSYGITAISFLLSMGISPAIASGSTHVAEIFTTGASGLSHWRIGNVNKKLFIRLAIPGIIGGVLGVFLITSVDGPAIMPWVFGYLLVMGFYIFFKAFKKISLNQLVNYKKVVPLAFIGGFFDSIAGVWGPIVTTTLVSSGHEPKETIGSVNLAEFFVTLVTGFSFTLLIGISHWEIIAGLICGGLIAAPIAARITSKLPTKFLLILVGSLVAFISALNLYKFLF